MSIVFCGLISLAFATKTWESLSIRDSVAMPTQLEQQFAYWESLIEWRLGLHCRPTRETLKSRLKPIDFERSPSAMLDSVGWAC